MKILLTGCQGQVGQSIIEYANSMNIELVACDKNRLDITHEENIQEILNASKIQGIINAAAYTAVDKAESEPEKALAVNAKGPEILAKMSAKFDIPLIHFSTDYIFDGEKSSPYVETDSPHPINIYGQSKWEGEEAIRDHCEKYIILRISWVFGEYGNNFVKSMLRLMKERKELKVVSDQKGCPTYAGDIAEVVLRLVQTSTHWGTYHYTGSPQTTWFDFAKAIHLQALENGSLQTKIIHPIRTIDYPTPAKRPQNSVLDCHLFEKTFKIKLQPWQMGLKKILEKMKDE